jgi:hypothetical protein
MGKLVKRAELTILGTLGIVIFSSAHLPGLLSSLDQPTIAPSETFTASVYEAVYSSSIPVEISPVAVNSETNASSTEDISLNSDLDTESSAQIFVEPSIKSSDSEAIDLIDPIDSIE